MYRSIDERGSLHCEDMELNTSTTMAHAQTIALKTGIIAFKKWHGRHIPISFQKEQAAAEVTIEQLSGGRRVRAKKRKVVRHEETIKKLMEELTGGTRTLKSFLSSLSHCVVSLDY